MKCRSCSMPAERLTPSGFCFDVYACDERRKAGASRTAHLRHPCVVKLFRHGRWCWIRKFGPKVAPTPPVLPKGFVAADYEANPKHVYYETVCDVGDASGFQPEEAIKLAKMFHGEPVNR